MKFNAPDRSTSSPKQYLKVGSGNSVVGVFRGEPNIFYQVYEDGKYKTVSADHPSGQFKFSINFIMKENGILVSKIFQSNYYDYKALKELHEEFNLEQTFVKVSQTGERQTKRMSFMPMTKQKVNEEQLRQVELQELDGKAKVPATSGDGDPGPEFGGGNMDDPDELPF